MKWQNAARALKVLYTSGYTDNAIVHQGRLDPGVLLLTQALPQVAARRHDPPRAEGRRLKHSGAAKHKIAKTTPCKVEKWPGFTTASPAPRPPA